MERYVELWGTEQGGIGAQSGAQAGVVGAEI